LRAVVVPSGRGRGRRQARGKGIGAKAHGAQDEEKTEIERHRALTWAARLKRVFAIEISACWR